ncbi:hypothetical protein [Rhizobium laguerreae]|uniref:hypothetical protein n=1 Tax=Rhizobium laguerreae TaxID=1076926 RepID=UPI001C91EC74|nr:hypothetical protein [Rhizobium laguerreae]MBY3231828.1 hypothetical protein [Rhizobium laguerreae]
MKIFAKGTMLGNPLLSSEVVTPVYIAPTMPPSYTQRSGADEKWGFLDFMVTEAGAAVNSSIGRVLVTNAPSPNAVYSMTGDTAGLAIVPDTGLIYVTNGSLLTVGIRTITVTATNLAGSASTTIRIAVVGTATNVIYIDPTAGDDSNTGTKPSQAIKTWAARTSKGSGTKTYAIRRGTVLDAAMVLANNETVRCYGDPALPAPKVITTSAFGLTGTDLVGATVQDVDISANQRAVHINRGTNFKAFRCVFRVPTDGTNRAPFYTTQLTGLVFRHNWVPANSYGDNVYCRGLKNAELAYNLLETPLGSTSDNMQITTERNALYPSSDVWIHHNTMVNVGGTSAKGNCVIEGCVRALVENNDFSGLYFCMSSVAAFNTIRNNRMAKATYSSNSFTMGIGSAYDTGEQSWYDNRLSSPGNRAFSISGTGEAAGAPLWSRYDLEINDNIGEGHTTFFHQNRLMSGYFQYNVGQNNVSNTVSGVTTVATGGDYTTRTVTPNFLNAGEGPVCLERARITGLVQEGQTVTVSEPVFAGAVSLQYQWRLNGKYIDGATDQSFTIPAGYGAQISDRVPTFATTGFPGGAAGELSCITRGVDAAGNVMIAPALFANDEAYMPIAA